MKLRSVLFWLHLMLGISAGIVILIMSVTGVLLMYQKQMLAWSDRSAWAAAPSPETQRQPIDAMIASVRDAQPGAKPSAITVYSDPNAPVMVAAGAAALHQSLYRPCPWREKGMRTFFQYVTGLHRWLAANGESRAIARSITGASNLIFLFIVCSGLYLWWPRRWTKSSVRSVTWFRRGLSDRSRNFNWHNTFGFWSAVPLFFIVLSGVVMSYPWANDLVYRVSGSPLPTPAAPRPPEQQPHKDAAVIPENRMRIDDLWETASHHVPGWKGITLRLPNDNDAYVSFTIDRGNGGQPQLRSTLILDRQDAHVVGYETFQALSLGRRARSWFRFVHTGEFYGMAGQTIAGVASFAGAMLVCTGFLLSFRRLRLWIGRRGQRNDILPERPWESTYDRANLVGNDQG